MVKDRFFSGGEEDQEETPLVEIRGVELVAKAGSLVYRRVSLTEGDPKNVAALRALGRDLLLTFAACDEAFAMHPEIDQIEVRVRLAPPSA